MTTLTKKAFLASVKLSGAKFHTPKSLDFAFQVSLANHSKLAMYNTLNCMVLTDQLTAINDLIDNTAKLTDLDTVRRVEQIKNWIKRGNVVIKHTDKQTISFAKNKASIKAKSIARAKASQANGKKTIATKKANAKTVKKAAKITAKQSDSRVSEPKIKNLNTAKQSGNATTKNQKVVDMLVSYKRLDTASKTEFLEQLALIEGLTINADIANVVGK